jgi:hypothetical protein
MNKQIKYKEHPAVGIFKLVIWLLILCGAGVLIYIGFGGKLPLEWFSFMLDK